MIWFWLACSSPPAPPPPPVVVELSWPGATVEQVDTALARPVDEALVAAPVRRCEATEGFLRCVVEGLPLPAAAEALAAMPWPDGAEEPVVRPLPLPDEPVVLVLDAAPAAWTWDPGVWVHRRWPVAQVQASQPLPDDIDADGLAGRGAQVRPRGEVRCDGADATALWVRETPQVPPPDGVDVRTWRPTQGTFVEGTRPAMAVAPRGSAPWCAQVHEERVEGLIDLPPAEAAAQWPGAHVVPSVAWSRRYRGPVEGLGARAEVLRERDDVWAVRQVHDVAGPQEELVVDGERLRALGLAPADLARAFGARSVPVGDVRLPVELPAVDALPPFAAGDQLVHLTDVATVSVSQVERVRVRVNGTRGSWVEVLVADPRHGAAVDAAVGLPPVGEWAMRRHAP